MSAEKKIWVNGKLLSYPDATISPLDRGFTLGDGLFETMRVHQGEIIRLSKHLTRLRRGAKVIALPLPWSDAEFAQAVLQTLDVNHLQDAFIRLTVSRGVPSKRGLLMDEATTKPSLIIQCGEFFGYPIALYERGVHAIISTIRRNEHSPLANIKSLNYLDNILARREADAQGADDALLLNTAGELACASAANLFFVQDKNLITPPLSAGVLPGTMRNFVMREIAPRNGLIVQERRIKPNEIEKMDEAFLTNTLMGIMPLTSIDGQFVKSGKPGFVTSSLRKILDER
ncbi:MAG: hypothetical protein HN855_04790 [Anaerolineae bacterium]|nr:hypothetical protein [Anaerolineae bacterium]